MLSIRQKGVHYNGIAALNQLIEYIEQLKYNKIIEIIKRTKQIFS